MEKIITAYGKGVQAGNGDFPENVQCLQVVVFLEKLLGEKIQPLTLDDLGTMLLADQKKFGFTNQTGGN